MKKTIEDYGKNLDRIKKKLPAEREELSRERIELQDGKMCDLVAYDVKAYGYVEYAENIEQSNGDFRRTRSLIPFNYLDANMSKFRWDIYGVDVKLQQGIAKSFVEQFKKYQKAGKGFAGADKPISLKSFNVPFGYVKMLIHEECDEMAGVEQMDNIEDTFLRADTPALDIKIFNPPKSKNNFMNEYTEECQNKPQTRICHSYYYNVPVKWLGKRFFERAEWFRIHKPLYYKNNYLGEVTGTGGGIFDNLEIRKISDEELMTFDLINHGLDFGYTHPQVFSQNYYDYETDTLYIFGEVYSKKCKNSTFARKIKKFMNVEIICDSARPDGIAEMQDWGFNAIGAKKRWGSGKGRDYCWEWLQRCNKIVIDPERCPNTEKEFIKAEHEQLPDGSFSDAYPDLEEDTIMANIYALNRIIMTSRRNDGLYDDDVEEETVWNEKNV